VGDGESEEDRSPPDDPPTPPPSGRPKLQVVK
jgi:hypothetical protein